MILNLYLEHKNYFDIIAHNKIINFFVPGIKYLLFLWFAFNLINWNNKRKSRKDRPIIVSNFVILVKKFRSEDIRENKDFLYQEIKSIIPNQYKYLLEEIKLPFISGNFNDHNLNHTKIHEERINRIIEVATHLGCLDSFR